MAARAKTTKKTNTTAKTPKVKKVAPKKLKKSQVVENASSHVDLPKTSNEPTVETPKGGKKTLLTLAGVVLVLGFLYYFKDLFMVATVNGKPITRFAVISELEKQNGQSVVDNLITKELILQEASKKGVSVTNDDINNEVKKIEDELSAQGQTLDQVLEMQGLSKSDVEENLRVKLYIERILADQISVSDEDAQTYFNENKTLYPNAKFEDEKAAIKESLAQQKLQESFQTLITDLKANAKINYFKTY
jgi:predicted transcriptional regulator